VQDDLQLVERVFDEIKQVDYGPLGEMLKMVLGGGGKLMRPGLALLSGRFGKYDLDRLVPLAASVELLHTATLVHDDVIDNADTRRGRPTVNSVFQNSTTVMLGDFLFAHAADQVVRTDELRVVKLFSQTLMVMAKGEIRQDMAAYDSRQTIRDYLARIGGKTASLFSTACEGGAIVAGEPDDHVAALRDYGYNFGMAFQVVDDVLDYSGEAEETGKSLGDDLAEGKPTLPLIRAMQAANPQDAALVRRAIVDGGRAGFAPVLAVIRSSGALDYAREAARVEAELGARSLAGLPQSAWRDSLLELASFSVTRRS
jgi:geranylgeranyl pyrophosphate synthase